MFFLHSTSSIPSMIRCNTTVSWPSLGGFDTYRLVEKMVGVVLRFCHVVSSDWLVVSTHLKNISHIGSFPQVGVKIFNIRNHQVGELCKHQTSFQNTSGHTTSPIQFFVGAILREWVAFVAKPLFKVRLAAVIYGLPRDISGILNFKGPFCLHITNYPVILSRKIHHPWHQIAPPIWQGSQRFVCCYNLYSCTSFPKVDTTTGHCQEAVKWKTGRRQWCRTSNLVSTKNRKRVSEWLKPTVNAN